jgi:hypothetical protein
MTKTYGLDSKIYSHPLLSIDEERNQLPHSFATATIASMNDEFYLITPAHALNSMGGKPVYLSVDPTPISLASKKVIKSTPADIAVVKLTNSEIDQIFETSVIITEEMVNLAYESIEYGSVFLEGYPANKNKQKIRKKKITRSLVQINFSSLVDDYFPDDTYVKDVHFAYGYNEKELYDNTGTKVNPRQLAGMSGGLFKAVSLGGNALPLGIFLAQDKGKFALIGLDYRFIFKWLKANSADL